MTPIPLILQTGFGLYIANHILNSLCSQGPKGEGGPQGAKGDRGPRGVEGDRGPRGVKGLQGHEGKQGPKGFMGIMGVQGMQGLQGARGERGSPGLLGERGIVGVPVQKTITKEATDLILANKIRKQNHIIKTPTKAILFKDGLSGSFTQIHTSIDKR